MSKKFVAKYHLNKNLPQKENNYDINIFNLKVSQNINS